MKINWKVRLKNKFFWITIIPAILLLIQNLLSIFKVHIDLESYAQTWIAIVSSVFAILSCFGVVVDPTTDGIGDSNRALTYMKPFKDEGSDEDLPDKIGFQ